MLALVWWLGGYLQQSMFNSQQMVNVIHWQIKGKQWHTWVVPSSVNGA